ncbi:energy-coupling factor ABC transporter substrate-binding protein [Parabacteroides sp. FAFU027]|uniref:energy-coupling factor ABC transporter substrate-binding protein n=1 Tax=Parabacteroides sp. FAFU027 TaxID=2922715 RepID=UPI001FAFF208|nr:energy-coupling factor ABC transporter substrate-binding protein [Parabacteroides sp. FAFU027]
MKNNHIRILSASIFLLIVAGLYMYNFRQDLPGADDNASTVIGQIAPAYKPWCKSISFDLTKEMEALFFGLQMLSGVVIFAICFRFLKKSGQKTTLK